MGEKIESLQEECIGLQEHLDLSQEQLSRLREAETPPKSTEEILKMKLLKLQSDIVHKNEVNTNTGLFLPENDPKVVRVQLKNELKELIKSAETIRQILTEKRLNLEQVTEEKENIIIQQTQIHEVMHNRLEELRESSQAPQNRDNFAKTYGRELSTKRVELEKQRKKLKLEMSGFLNTHFPAMDAAENPTHNEPSRFTSLQHILDDLIAVALNKPEDPYLTIGSQHWPSHIEVLLSYSIASRHPSDPNKIKMNSLHL